MPGTRCAGGGIGAGGWSGAAAEHRGNAAHQCLFDELRADKVDVRVDAAGRENLAFAGDDLGSGADGQGNAGLHVRVAGFADAADATVLDGDVRLDDAPVVKNQGVGDDRVCDLGTGQLALPHAVADDLAAAEFHLVAVVSVIFLHADPQLRVAQAHAVAGGRTVHARVARRSMRLMPVPP